jgi:hypothetical protein
MNSWCGVAGPRKNQFSKSVVYPTLKAPARSFVSAKVTFVPPSPAALVIWSHGLFGALETERVARSAGGVREIGHE